jgi:hypothetical protein
MFLTSTGWGDVNMAICRLDSQTIHQETSMLVQIPCGIPFQKGIPMKEEKLGRTVADSSTHCDDDAKNACRGRSVRDSGPYWYPSQIIAFRGNLLLLAALSSPHLVKLHAPAAHQCMHRITVLCKYSQMIRSHVGTLLSLQLDTVSSSYSVKEPTIRNPPFPDGEQQDPQNFPSIPIMRHLFFFFFFFFFFFSHMENANHLKVEAGVEAGGPWDPARR